MENKIKKFIDYLEKNMKVKLSFKNDNFYYFIFVGVSDVQGSAAYIPGAKHQAGIGYEDLQVLVEYPTIPNKRKFAFHGHRMIADMLSKIYGGYVSLNLYWDLDNRPNASGHNPFGFNPKLYNVDNIDAHVIVKQATHLLKSIS